MCRLYGLFQFCFFGLAALAVLLLCVGCGTDFDDCGSTEALDVGKWANEFDEVAAALETALQDGRLQKAEYNEIYRIRNVAIAKDALKYRRTKQRLEFQKELDSWAVKTKVEP